MVRNMGISTLWLWVMMILVLVKGWLCSGCLKQERIALLQLKADINYPNGTSLPSWAEEEEEKATNCCQWEGVECSNTTSRVTRLSLNFTRKNELGDWYFNASLFLPFEDLTTLYLPENSLAGWVENEGFERLTRLSKLEVLDLSLNSLNSSVLSSLSGLLSLKYLSLRRNQLGGSTHGFGGLTGLSNLEVLDLSDNQLNNNINSFLKLDDFVSLKKLDLSSNDIKSFEPRQGLDRESILRDLEVLDLCSNNFNNNIWSSLSRFPSLKTLYLMWNKLNGTFHRQDLENLSSLENLFLDGATLESDFLPSIRVLTSLQVLTLQECGLTGSLPTQEGLCELKTLRELDLKGNELGSNLPWCMANLTSLRFLDISDNHFTGNIASSPLINLTSLEYLAVSDNHGFQIPISFRSFFNHSRLKFVKSLNNKLLAEEEFLASAPSFQLIGIRLSNSANGSLYFPQFLYHQHDLQEVGLSRIDFSGEKFPNWLLENNTRMVTLLLQNNSFCGPLSLPSRPATELLALDISNNHLQGCVPYEMAGIFPKLQFLNMSTNGFECGIPSSLGDMTSLSILDLSSNRLSGEIPMHLAVGCRSLVFLILSNNNLKGPILPPQNNLTKLFYLYVDRNIFTEIPHSLSRSSSLSFLNVSENQLSGRIPGWMGNMPLDILVMAKNHLEGPIPTEFCRFHCLLLLDISENNITGNVPSCFKPPTIKVVQLSKNRLQGPFPKAFRNSSELRMLDLSHNNLNNNIPDWIGGLSSLTILLLRNNHFAGNIPNQICHLSELSMIDLSFNNLFGNIPPCLNNIKFNESSKNFEFAVGIDSPASFSQLASLLPDMNMASNSKNTDSTTTTILGPPTEVEFTTKGMSLSYKGVVLNLFSGIDLSSNKLSGHIPLEIGDLSQIKGLNLSHNYLTGSIPGTFSYLKSIESLDLSYNNLNGNIPSQLTGLDFLGVFNVSYNNLTGRIPKTTAHSETFDLSSYLGNPRLCGEPLPRHCSAIDSPPTMPRDANGSEVNYGFIDMEAFYVSFAGSYITILLGTAAILFINPYWRRAWFHFVEDFVTYCYYFVVDNLPRLRGGII